MDYCISCSNTGIYKQPHNVAEFEKEFDRLDNPGNFTMEHCYNKAIDKVGYTVITPCPHCNREKK